MHAVSSYPTRFENININIVSKYKKLSENNNKIRVGYSSHDIGYLGSMLAIAAGATVIEKHIKAGHTPWMHFDDTAIDVKLELPLFIENLNKAFVSLGDEKKKVYNHENHKYAYLKK
jgi:N-acetylneuraminate synthase